MQRTIRTVTLRIIFSFFLAAGWAQSSWAIEDAIIAVVNDDVITFRDLQDYLSASFMRLKIENTPSQQIQGIMEELQITGLQKLIQDKLILNEAALKEIKIPETLLNERIEKIKAQYPSQEKFVESLLSEGYTLTDLRNRIRDQLLIQQVVDQEIRLKITINPQEMTDYYEKYRQKFLKPERINLDSIFIKSESDKQKAKQKTEEAYTLLEEGRDFSEISKKYSEAPSVGVIAKGQMRSDIENIIFGIKLNGLSPIIEVDNGYYIFKLLGRMPAKIQEIEEVKDIIYDMIFQEKFKVKFSSWIDELGKKAYIEIKE